MQKIKINAKTWENLHDIGFNSSQIVEIGVNSDFTLYISQLNNPLILSSLQRCSSDELRFIVCWIENHCMHSFEITMSKISLLFNNAKLDLQKSTPKITAKLLSYSSCMTWGELSNLSQAEIKAYFECIIDGEMHYKTDYEKFNSWLVRIQTNEESKQGGYAGGDEISVSPANILKFFHGYDVENPNSFRIDQDEAFRLESCVGMSWSYWLYIQRAYDDRIGFNMPLDYPYKVSLIASQYQHRYSHPLSQSAWIDLQSLQQRALKE